MPLPPDEDYPSPTDDPGGFALNFRVMLPVVLCTATVVVLGYAGMHIGRRSEFSTLKEGRGGVARSGPSSNRPPCPCPAEPRARAAELDQGARGAMGGPLAPLRRGPGHGPVGESPSLAQLQNQQNRDQHYLALPAPKYSETSTYKTVESSDYIKDICPYATFQLNATGPASKAYSDAGSTCSFSGNIYSGPYHSVRGSFVYHDGTDTYKLRHVSDAILVPSRFFTLPAAPSRPRAPLASVTESRVPFPFQQKEPEYTKVRRKKSKLRDPHAESQGESDRVGLGVGPRRVAPSQPISGPDRLSRSASTLGSDPDCDLTFPFS